MGIDFGPFLVVVALITVSPGPDTVLVLNRALAGGRVAGVATASGSALGLVVWGFAAGLGIAALLAASALAFTVLKLVGAAYLVYLGVSLLLGSRKQLVRADRPREARLGALFRQGLATNLLNPKAAAFFTALLPQFTPREHAVAATLLMAVIAAAASFVGLCTYASAAARARNLLRRPRPRRWLDRITGSVLVGLGTRLALAGRGR